MKNIFSCLKDLKDEILTERIEKYVVIYDIFEENTRKGNTAARKRNRIRRALYEYGVKAQLSLFEIECSSSELKKLKKNIEKNINKFLDKVYIYPVDKKNNEKIKRYGNLDTVVNDYFV